MRLIKYSAFLTAGINLAIYLAIVFHQLKWNPLTWNPNARIPMGICLGLTTVVFLIMLLNIDEIEKKEKEEGGKDE